jgi:ABC-type branched-subunit amino acid transport system substrate-binding protein
MAVIAVIVLLAGFAAVGCGDDDDDGGGGGGGGGEQASTDCTASIGAMAPITGDAAELGEEQRNWAQFGLDRFNRENGTKFKLVEGDTQLDPGQASTVAQQFVSNDAITAVVGPAGSQEVEAVGPLFERASLPFVSQSATQTDLTEGDNPTFSRVVPKDDVRGPTDAQYMVDELGAKNVLIVDDQTSYSTTRMCPRSRRTSTAFPRADRSPGPSATSTASSGRSGRRPTPRFRSLRPGITAWPGVELAEAIQAACEEGDASREAVADQIRQVNMPESIVGQPITFDQNGDLENAKFLIFTVKGGEFELAE